MDSTTRAFLFIFGCLGSRLLLAYYAKVASLQHLGWMGYLALIPAFGFAYLYISGARPTGPEAGGKIWWNSQRPIHSFLYAMFAFFAIQHNRNAWMFLFADFCVGLVNYIMHKDLRAGRPL